MDVGRGIADITGEVADVGLMGYGRADQQAAGLHTRLRARAFVLADGSTRLLLVVCDLPLVFDSVYRAVLRRLRSSYEGTYSEANTLVTGTHTHCGPGGYSHHRLYNITTHGFHPTTFEAIVDGIAEAVARAHADLAPTEVGLARGELHDANVNRSRESFERNPLPDKEFFPDAIDPQTTVLAFRRGGRLVGAIDFFATHGTSMTGDNRLVSADNKGYAGWYAERVAGGVDYLAPTPGDVVFAFANTNAGDMSPNLRGAPGLGPTDDDVANTRIIGRRQYDAAAALLDATDPLDGPLDHRHAHVDLGHVSVAAEFTPDGRPHRTWPATGGAGSLAGAGFDGPAFGFHEGRNPIPDLLSRQIAYRLFPALRDAQAPKGIALPSSLNRRLGFVQERVPVQLLRIGRLYLVGMPCEVTIVAGLRLRRAVAAAVGADVLDVLVVGYSNAYAHYVTTPEEYDVQRYEGGSTLFGRWELPAFVQTVTGLARAMADGVPVLPGPPPPATAPGRSGERLVPDEPLPGHELGGVVVAPDPSYHAGATVLVVLTGTSPNNDLHRGHTHWEVQQRQDSGWTRVADDGDWSTRLWWARAGEAASRVTLTWETPPDACGRFRFVYHGARRLAGGRVEPVTVATRSFTVSG
ncbi:MAG TPA: neutral/alkaline non-lysosomal ceramidase N-terminal domain-containing protein [Mycobacteriales bacterium]